MILFVQVGQWGAEPLIFTSLAAFRQGGSLQGLLTPHGSSPSPQGFPRPGLLDSSALGEAFWKALLHSALVKTIKEDRHWAHLTSQSPTTSVNPQPHPTFGFQDTTKHNLIFGNSRGIWTIIVPTCLHLLKPAQKTGIHTWSA